MFTAKRIVLFCAIAAVIIGIAFVVTPDDDPDAVVNEPAALANVEHDPGDVQVATDIDQPVTTPNEITATDNCLTPEQLETHPLVMQEAIRVEALATSGPSVEVFRGHSRAQVASFAAQGDSAAMVVLGAMAMTRASGYPEDRAIDYLLVTDIALRTHQYERPLATEVANDLREAYDWFYKGAMHGRVLALINAGEALYALDPDPVNQGFIQQADYDALTRKQKNIFNLTNLYSRATAKVVGEQSDGMLEMLFTLAPTTDDMDAIADSIARKFHDDVHAAGLDAIDIPETAMPPIEEMIGMVCEQFHPQQDDN